VQSAKNPKRTSYNKKPLFKDLTSPHLKDLFNTYQWTLSQIYPNQMGMTAFSPSLIKDVLKWQNSSPVTKQSMVQELLTNIWNSWYCGLVSLNELSRIAIQGLCPTLWNPFAKISASNRTFPQHFTLALIDRQNKWTLGWNNIYDHGQHKDRTTRLNYSLLQNIPTILGEATQLGNYHMNFWLGSNPK